MAWISGANYVAQDASQNIAELRKELENAILQNRPVLLPAGIYRLNCDQLPGGVALDLNDNLVIKGAGRSVTILRIGPDLISSVVTLFHIRAFKTVTFEDLTIEGPPGLSGVDPGGSDALGCEGIYHEGGGELKLKNVTMRAWKHCIKADALDKANQEGSRLTLSNSLIGGRHIGLLQFEGNGPTPASLTVERCVFEHDTNAYTAVNDNQHHNLYIAEGVDVTFRNCRWTKSVTYGIVMYGGHGRMPLTQPLFEHCEFDGAVQRALLTNKMAKTNIRNCVFRNPSDGAVQITLRGDAEIVGCHFEAAQKPDIYAIHDDQNVDAAINVSDCTFGGSFLYYAYRVQPNSEKQWRFLRCRFGAPLAHGVYLGTHGNVGKLKFSTAILRKARRGV